MSDHKDEGGIPIFVKILLGAAAFAIVAWSLAALVVAFNIHPQTVMYTPPPQTPPAPVYPLPQTTTAARSADLDRYRQFGSDCQAEADARTRLHGRPFVADFSGSVSTPAHCHVDGGFSESGAIRDLTSQ